MTARKKATLRDVAAWAGVSTATVRRVLTEQGYVAPETRRAVEDALAATVYRPNVLAQSLRIQRTAVIGHILYAISPNPFYAQVALGAEQEALRHGYSILAMNVQGDAAREKMAVETLIRRRVDAILFTTPVSIENVKMALDDGVAVVQVERPTGLNTNMVLVDNYAGAVMATEHLIGLGHRRIAFMGANFTHDPSRASQLLEEQRVTGFLDTMSCHGLSLPEKWVALGTYYSIQGSGTPGDGCRFMHCFLDDNPRPTAIFAACDFMAAGAYQAIYARGLRVPQDISVVGFDDTLGPYLAPPLTTVAQPMLAIGQAAVELAIAQIDHKPNGAWTEGVRRLEMAWVKRASTAPPQEKINMIRNPSIS